MGGQRAVYLTRRAFFLLLLPSSSSFWVFGTFEKMLQLLNVACLPAFSLFFGWREGRMEASSTTACTFTITVKLWYCEVIIMTRVQWRHPTNNALLVRFRLSSDAEIFVANRRLSRQVGAKRAKTCACNVYVFWLSFHFCMPPLVVGQSQKKKKTVKNLSWWWRWNSGKLL